MTTKTKKKKLPSFKDVILKRLWWWDDDGKPILDDPPIWSLGGKNIDIGAMDYAITCIDGESDFPEMAETVNLFPKLSPLSKPLAYLRQFYLMMDWVFEHADEDPTCDFDSDDDDLDLSTQFRVMHIVEAAYRMGYVDASRKFKTAGADEELAAENNG
jgi:hypothetical protein